MANAQPLPDRLAELGFTLPPIPKAVATYIPATRCGDLVYCSGQLPMVDGSLVATGAVPDATSLEAAQAAAAVCVMNGLAATVGVLDGDWDKLVRCVRLGVFVQSAPGFSEQHLVANGASQRIGDIMGDAGRHARAAVGVPSLPLDAAVEVELLFQVR